MKPETRYSLILGVLVLFLIQSSGTLIESVYILDLMHTSLDAKVLGVLFFFTPLLWLWRKRWPGRREAWGLAACMVLARAATPYLGTNGRLWSAGIATALGWMLFAWFLGAVRLPDPRAPVRGLALGFGLSVMLRTVNFGVDYSLMPYGGWLGVALGIGLLVALPDVGIRQPATLPGGSPFGVKAAALGSVVVVALGWFAFAAPAVIARWTDGPYVLIVTLVALGCALWGGVVAPRLRLSGGVLVAWNLLFALTLTATILVHRVPFPVTPNDPPVVVTPPSAVQHIPLILTLLLFPVLFEDFARFGESLSVAATAPRAVLPGLLWGLVFTMILVFVQVFTNVWGYVEPVSTPFRNQFWLPYAALALALTIAVARVATPETARRTTCSWGDRALSLAVLLVTVWGLSRGQRLAAHDELPVSLWVMTYNIQAGNNLAGERDFDAQLALIREIRPDILALQESDTTRLSLNNNDLVRYFADQLGYYAYYGPTTVAGTFGTALLSRFPIRNPRVIYAHIPQFREAQDSNFGRMGRGAE